jgi:hypothetical protein
MEEHLSLFLVRNIDTEEVIELEETDACEALRRARFIFNADIDVLELVSDRFVFPSDHVCDPYGEMGAY